MDFLDEVKEELRQEQMLNFFKKYGKMIGILLLSIILITAFTSWFTNYSFNKKAQDGLAIYQANQAIKDKPESKAAKTEALAIYGAIANNGTKGYQTLAQLRQASLLVEQGEGKKAFEIYESIYQNGSGKTLSQLAGLYAAHIALDVPEYADANTMQQRLEKLGKAGAPFEILAKELHLAYATVNEDTEKARTLYYEIMSMPSLTNSIKERIAALAPDQAAE